jgi:hypothetical protein
MKKLQYLLLPMLFCATFTAQSQTQTDSNKSEEKNVKEMNLLDEQAKLMGSIFGGMEEDLDGTKDPFKNVNSYQDLLNNSNFDPETKAKLMAMYKLYDQSLDPKQKDSLKLSLEKLFLKNTELPNN